MFLVNVICFPVWKFQKNSPNSETFSARLPDSARACCLATQLQEMRAQGLVLLLQFWFCFNTGISHRVSNFANKLSPIKKTNLRPKGTDFKSFLKINLWIAIVTFLKIVQTPSNSRENFGRHSIYRARNFRIKRAVAKQYDVMFYVRPTWHRSESLHVWLGRKK